MSGTKKRVVFIEPSGEKTNVFDNYMKLPLMGSLFLGTVLDEAGYDVTILNENILGRQIDPFEVRADVYCITALTVSSSRAKLLAKQFEKLYPEALVIIGGIHASLRPEEYDGVGHHVVTGEAEGIIVDLVEGRFKERHVHGSKVEDLESLPLTNYSLLENLHELEHIPLMSSRGCPFNCNFCAVTKVFGKKFRKLSAERLVAEMENGIAHSGNRHFFFYDDNFTADRKRIERFCEIIEEKKLKVTWIAQVRSDLAKNPELIARMVKAGLRWAFIGFETINDEVLKAYHKGQTRADIERAIKTLHDHGVNIHGMFMFGEDHDTVEGMRETVDFAIDNEIETVQFMILTPFPGTVTYQQLEDAGRLLHKDWDYYNGMYTVFRPKNMSAATLTEVTHKAYRRFYSARRTLMDTVQMITNVFLDALVWNFERADRYSMDIMLIRAGAKLIVSRQAELTDSYTKYLKSLELKEVGK